LRTDAEVLQDAGAQLFVIEAVPAPLAAELTDILAVPTIGIGAGPDCSGQVLVLHDLLGITPGKRPRFVRDFVSGEVSILAGVESYVRAVKEGTFPDQEHLF
jgi:3-methyl-2-oxobutanoate hydroxymethyltransferase